MTETNNPSGAAADALAPTPMVDSRFGYGKEPAYRMDAYWYGFSPTGLDVVDRILCAVACAGKGYHHTEDWNQEATPREACQRGTSPAEIIQNAALDSADMIRSAVAAMIAERDVLAAENRALREDSDRYRDLAVIDDSKVDWVKFKFVSDGPWQGHPVDRINRKPWLDAAIDDARAAMGGGNG